MSGRYVSESSRSSHRSPPRYSDHSTRAPNGTFREHSPRSRSRSSSPDYCTPRGSPTPDAPSPPSSHSVSAPPPPYATVVGARADRHDSQETHSARQSISSSSSSDGFTMVTRRRVIDKPAKKPLFDTPPRRATVQISGTMADRVERRVENLDDGWGFLENGHLKKKVQACYSSLLPIQKPAIAAIQMGADLSLAAPKGYGRSTAWMIPVLDSLASCRWSPGVINCLVVASTEQKAVEIGAQLNLVLPRDLNQKRVISTEWFWKEERMHEYITTIRQRGSPLVITTVNLLSSFLSHAHANLDQLKFLIFEDFDQVSESKSERWMLLRRDSVTARTQVIVISSEDDGSNYADSILRERWSVEVRANRVDEILPSQYYSCMADADAAALELLKIIEQGPAPIAVFFKTEEIVSRMYDWLQKNGITRVGRVCQRSGNHELWSHHMEDFRKGRADVFLVIYDDQKLIDSELLALDVFFELPSYLDKHAIRVSRNGRMRSGRAITFICPGDADLLPALIKSHSSRGLPIDSLMKIYEDLQNQKNRVDARHSRAVMRAQLQRQLEVLDIADDEDERAEKKMREDMRRNNDKVCSVICEGSVGER